MKLELKVASPLQHLLKSAAPNGVEINYPTVIEKRTYGPIEWVPIVISWAGSVPIGVLTHYLIKHLENRPVRLKTKNGEEPFSKEIIERMLKNSEDSKNQVQNKSE